MKPQLGRLIQSIKRRSGVILAWLLSIGITLWIVTGGTAPTAPEVSQVDVETLEPPALVKVRVKQVSAEPIAHTITLNGETSARRSVTVRAEISGKVTNIYKAKGQWVTQDDLLLKLDTADIKAQLSSAEAMEEQRLQELRANQQLSEQGLNNATQLAAAKALYQQAKAQTLKLKIQLANTEVRAPFAGYLNSRPVEIGSYVRAGDGVAEILELEPLLVTAQVSENDVLALHQGQDATITLLNGDSFPAKVDYISANANQATRTYQIDLEVQVKVPQPIAGSTAEVSIEQSTVLGHFISPALLILDDDGNLGLKIVDQQDRVQFVNVELAETTPGGVWVTGLPDPVNLITAGQGYVENGEQVEPVMEQSESSSMISATSNLTTVSQP